MRESHKGVGATTPYERTNELTNEQPPQLLDEKVEESDAHARVAGGRLAYVKTCAGCGSDIFMAVCRDGRWRPFETKRQAVPLPFAWAWRKRIGMEETDLVCGHFIHYCADFHDRAFRVSDDRPDIAHDAHRTPPAPP